VANGLVCLARCDVLLMMERARWVTAGCRVPVSVSMDDAAAQLAASKLPLVADTVIVTWSFDFRAAAFREFPISRRRSMRSEIKSGGDYFRRWTKLPTKRRWRVRDRRRWRPWARAGAAHLLCCLYVVLVDRFDPCRVALWSTAETVGGD